MIRSAYSPRVPVGLVCGPGRTKQSCKDECDINRIMAKYRKSGLIAHVNKYQGNYADVSSGMDYRDSLEFVRRADGMFLSLPAQLRSQFNNDPGAFLRFCEDPANVDKMREMGLLPKTPPKEEPEAPPQEESDKPA